MKPLYVLVSNDDGYRSAGIESLATALAEVCTVSVVAPDRNRSGASNSLTLQRPVRPQVADNGFCYVDGTPTDCVHLAITGLLDQEPDMVISGINAGANLGDDVLYSGTVAAAMEGRSLGLPSLAVSLVLEDGGHYHTAARVVLRVLEGLDSLHIPSDAILNINVPDRPWHELQGFAITRQGNRHKAEPVIRDTDPEGAPIYWVGPPGAAQDAGPGTDFHAVQAGMVSITPLKVDFTDHGAMAGLAQWAGKMTGP